MAYGKDDFVNFSDLDLDELLGDFTESEFDFSDCENDKSSNSKQSVKKDKPKKQYECDECSNTYASISGLRGHLRTKHGKANVKASQYRKDASQSKGKTFKLDQSHFRSVFSEILPQSLQNVQDSKFRNLKSSVHGKGIITIARSLIENVSIQEQLLQNLEPLYYNVLSTAADADNNTNEALFQKFHELMYDENLISSVSEILCQINSNSKTLPIRQFISVLNRQLIEDLIKNRTKIYKQVTKAEAEKLTQTDQSVVFYISGYIIRHLEQRLKSKKCNTSEVLDSLLKNEGDSEKTFVGRFSEWTEAVNRGGLKVPSDNFFLFIRACKLCLRNNIDEKKLCSTSYVSLKEIIMEDHMVKYYSEKLVSGKFSSFVIEQSIVIFLNVRGPAAARKKKLEILKTSTESTKSMRKVLQDKSNRTK